jgi:hypothetical protein
MLQTTWMISLAIEIAQPPITTAAIVAPIINAANVIASLYTHLASARVANRTNVVVCYERMIDHLKREEEEDLKAHFN